MTRGRIPPEVEAVARVLFEQQTRSLKHEWEDLPGNGLTKRHYRRLARAAIAALPETQEGQAPCAPNDHNHAGGARGPS